MSNPMRLAAAIAIIAVVAFAGLNLFRGAPPVGGPSPSPVASPTASPTPARTPGPTLAATPVPTPGDTSTWKRVTSARFGISYKVPPTWTTTPANQPWIWQVNDPGPASTDETVGPADEGFRVASEKIPAGMTNDAWWADYLGQDTSSNPFGCFPTSLSLYRVETVDGQTAYIHGERATCNFSEAIILTGGRAYQLTAQPNLVTIPLKVFDPGMFEGWLTTVHFDPASADDTPVASPGPS